MILLGLRNLIYYSLLVSLPILQASIWAVQYEVIHIQTIWDSAWNDFNNVIYRNGRQGHKTILWDPLQLIFRVREAVSYLHSKIPISKEAL